MKYAQTAICPDGIERVVQTLPLDAVPYFDPKNPHPNTYGVPDEVEVGWEKGLDGVFRNGTRSLKSFSLSVSRFQARAALMQAGLLDDVEDYMTAPNTDPFHKLAWEEATVFHRSSPTVAILQEILGLTDVQLDDLFLFASTISA